MIVKFDNSILLSLLHGVRQTQLAHVVLAGGGDRLRRQGLADRAREVVLYVVGEVQLLLVFLLQDLFPSGAVDLVRLDEGHPVVGDLIAGFGPLGRLGSPVRF